MTLSEIEPATFGLVINCLNQLRHRVPQYMGYIPKNVSGGVPRFSKIHEPLLRARTAVIVLTKLGVSKTSLVPGRRGACDLCIPVKGHFSRTESICEPSRVQTPRPSALLICCVRDEGLNCQIYFTSGLRSISCRRQLNSSDKVLIKVTHDPNICSV